MAATPGFTATFTGTMFASPLYLENGPGGKGLFFAVTTGNDVFALDETTGAIVWQHNIGSSPQDSGAGCGGIHPIGIESTPVIDAASRTIFVAGAIGTATISRHEVHALSVDDGTEKAGWPVDVSTVPASGGTTFMPQPANQRSALSLVGGTLYVGVRRPRRRLRPVPRLGHRHQRGEPGHEGRLGHGRAGRRDLGGGRHGVRRQRRVRVDGQPHRRRRFDAHGQRGGRAHHRSRHARRCVLSVALDVDGLGRRRHGVREPRCTWRFRARRRRRSSRSFPKDGHLYLLDAANLGGVDGHKVDFTVAGTGMSIHTAPAAYRTAMGSYFVFSTTSNANMCPGGVSGRAVVAVKIAAANPPTPSIAWCAPMSSVTTGPIATTTNGTDNAIVWFTSGSSLVGVDGDTGAQIVSSGNCSGVQRWTSPIAVKGRIVAGGNGHLCSWSSPQ